MATKKKKKAARKPAPKPKRAVRKKAPAKAAKPKPAPAEISMDTPIDSSNALVFAVLALGIMALIWFGLSSRKGSPAPTDAAPAAATAPAPAAASTPEARSIATPAPKAEAPKAAATAHREDAGSEPALSFDRSLGQALTLRCWRSEGGVAELDVFGEKNRVVRAIMSETGPAGWVDLSWDGMNARGKKVSQGTYYLRASQKAEQIVRDVQVK
jgi:FlgD Ig-like domain